MQTLDLELENLMLRRTNLELQSRLMAAEHEALTARIKELQNARPNAGGAVQSDGNMAPALDTSASGA